MLLLLMLSVLDVRSAGLQCVTPDVSDSKVSLRFIFVSLLYKDKKVKVEELSIRGLTFKGRKAARSVGDTAELEVTLMFK